ncbi:aldo/keto reductase [Roseisolibacter sp. H3M3-2]|uniref:aldo/keto reductase n=1 Tax=Roseisolibacter sp. H3M3-2 TaxID=3031323 RepID=UPI0023D989BB|nr:aldo/keto reductase [Roseisolibacter sp. H3M3-2]MDF1502948.1 aldo/keto reductase [Roseisolibacter sp. H3M3-2]
MVDRRAFLGLTLGAGASLALTPAMLRALQGVEALRQPGALLQRAIPSTGEMIPAVGLSFSNHVSCADPAALRDVLRAFADGGGRVFDAMHGNARAEEFHAAAATGLGIERKLFWSTRGAPPGGPGGPPPPGAAAAKAHVAATLARLKVSRLDLVMVNPAADPTHLGALQEEKQAGRVRYVGAQVISDNLYPELEAAMRNEPLDFVGVDYDVGNRARVEDTILPLAAERKIAVMAFFPFGNNGGVSCGSGRNLFARVGERPVPEWAAEFDATTWAQFFLKYVLGHPAVTVARVGTTKPTHMADNLRGGVGRLPDEATRRRMAAFVDGLPPIAPPPMSPAQAPGIALPAAVLDRYVGEYALPSGTVIAFRHDGARLLVKPGSSPELPLNARSETRFQDPRGPTFEFRLDAQGKVTGATLEQQGPQGPQRLQLERK